MLRLFSTNNGSLLRTLTTQFQGPRFLIPISHIHGRSKTQVSNPAISFILDEIEESESSEPSSERAQFRAQDAKPLESEGSHETPGVQISHPWPEWIELMQLLLKRGYFEGIGNPFQSSELGTKDSNQIRTACLNFARDRSDLIRFLSREDIQVVARCGCPSIDRKVINSGKRLRAHVGVDEGNVCNSCILRGDCDRAYVKASEDACGRTVDVMRIVLTYGLDPIAITVKNKPCLNKKVKESVRGLLKELVELSAEESDCVVSSHNLSKSASSGQGNRSQQQSQLNVPMKQGDWMCPSCNFLNFARNIRCLLCDGLFQERLDKLKEDQDQDHLPLKRGDWICDKCNFLNFAKNTRCLQCKEKPTKRQLNPGEWECESCNYINFRRNMICLKCDHKRPIASNPANYDLPQNDNGRRCHSMNDNQVGKLNVEKRVDGWKFVENDIEDQVGSHSWNEVPGFVDFPIVGGTSDLSMNKQQQERWNMKMTERSRNGARAGKNAEEFQANTSQRGFKFFECTDDEEMAEWFGQGKKNL